MKLISFANKNHVGLVNLQTSLTKCKGWEHILIGQDVKWEGWITRMKAYVDICSTISPEELIVLCDAFDVLCLQSSDQFSNVFKTFQKNIVIGSESDCKYPNCYEPKNYWAKCDIKQDEMKKYVNGGLMCGKASKLKEMWKWCVENYTSDDQYALGLYIDKYPLEVALDTKSILFFNDNSGQLKYEFNTIDNSITFNEVAIKPFFVHFQGVNIYSSLLVTNTFNEGKLFEVGSNYKKIGNHINGNDQINGFPADTRTTSLNMTIEHGVFYGIIVILILLCFYFWLA